MLYFSQKDNKFYKTEEELIEAEKEFDKVQEEERKKAKEKKARVKAIDEAFKKTQEVRKAAAAMIQEADDNYKKLREEFVKDYGSYHATYSLSDVKDENANTSDILNTWIKIFDDGWNILF